MTVRRIPQLDEHDLLSGRPFHEYTIEALYEYLSELDRAVAEGRIVEGGHTYQSYVTKIVSGDWDIKKIEYRISQSEQDWADDVSDFCLFYYLILHGGRSPNLKPEFLEYLNDEYGREYSAKPAYQYLKSLVYSKRYEAEYTDIALESAMAAASELSHNPYIQHNFAKLAIDKCRNSPQSDELNRINISTNSLLNKAKSAAERAIAEEERYHGNHAVLADIYRELGDYESARTQYREAIKLADEYDQPSERRAATRSLEFLELEAESQQLRSELAKARERLESIEEEYQAAKSDIAQAETEIKGLSEDYRTQSLQFIGFFAAIVAVTVGSVQISTTASSAVDAGGLIIVLIGGITFAFGALQQTVQSEEESVTFKDQYELPIAGLMLIAIGFVIIVVVNVPFSS